MQQKPFHDHIGHPVVCYDVNICTRIQSFEPTSNLLFQLMSCVFRRIFGRDSDLSAFVSGAAAGGLSMGLFYRSRAIAMYAAWKTLEVTIHK